LEKLLDYLRNLKETILKLICIRHTHVAVPPGICYGQSDVPLDDSYPQELQQVKAKLAGLTFGTVFSSPLIRCRQLTEDLFPREAIVFDRRLMELNFGQWELQPWDQIYATSEGKHWMDHYQEVSCPNGESYPEFRQRVMSFLAELKTKPFRQAALVTHGGVIRLIKSILENQSMDEVFTTFAPEYGGFYKFEIK
jgi:alpha-ribazole phosphatase